VTVAAADCASGRYGRGAPRGWDPVVAALLGRRPRNFAGWREEFGPQMGLIAAQYPGRASPASEPLAASETEVVDELAGRVEQFEGWPLHVFGHSLADELDREGLARRVGSDGRADPHEVPGAEVMVGPIPTARAAHPSGAAPSRSRGKGSSLRTGGTVQGERIVVRAPGSVRAPGLSCPTCPTRALGRCASGRESPSPRSTFRPPRAERRVEAACSALLGGGKGGPILVMAAAQALGTSVEQGLRRHVRSSCSTRTR
jgi:hypothetical protein